MRTVWYTILALMAFAANSILCRLALRGGTIDAATFCAIRILAGALMLLLVTAGARKQSPRATGSWITAGMLFLYVVPFSFAYLRLPAGTGALILFGCVQLTMMSAALRGGERPHALQWFGLCVALAGLIYLMLPGLSAPPWAGAALMALAGIAWGVYSLRSRASSSPLAQTTSNFVRCVPLVLAVNLAARAQFHAEPRGVLLAIASGAIASGLGYVVWYAALRGLTASRAAVLQLAVPILAAAAGAVFLKESLTARLLIAAAMVLGGIAAALFGRKRVTR